MTYPFCITPSNAGLHIIGERIHARPPRKYNSLLRVDRILGVYKIDEIAGESILWPLTALPHPIGKFVTFVGIVVARG
jgi:hypothetical protein